jgi:hypothetical protein
LPDVDNLNFQQYLFAASAIGSFPDAARNVRASALGPRASVRTPRADDLFACAGARRPCACARALHTDDLFARAGARGPRAGELFVGAGNILLWAKALEVRTYEKKENRDGIYLLALFWTPGYRPN